MAYGVSLWEVSNLWTMSLEWRICTISVVLELDDAFLSVLHNSYVIMSAMASQITGVSVFSQPFVQAQIKENTGARWIPPTKRQYRENCFHLMTS